MVTQYNVPIKVLDETVTWRIHSDLTGYSSFTDRSGNLEQTCFSLEQLPYVGEMIVIKTLKKQNAQIAYDVLSGIEGLVVLPITESLWEEELGNFRGKTEKVSL